MEIAAHTAPGVGVFLSHLWLALEALQLALDRLESFGSDIRATQPRRKWLKPDAHMIDLDDVFDGIRCDKSAATLDDLDQAFPIQPQDGFTHRRTANAQLRCQRPFGQRCTRG